jgi:hypothetical protein
MNIRLLLAGAAMATTSLTAAGAQAATITGLFSTGVDASGNVLAEGASEQHYTVDGLNAPFLYNNPNYIGQPGAAFIAVQADGGYTNPVNTYSLTFDLTGLNAATAQISGNFEADNFATVFLNGNQIAQDDQATVFSNFQSPTPFSAASGFVAGLNTLTFTVTDTGPPSALLVSDLTGTASAVPEPASWAMMLVGFGGLGVAMRTRRTRRAATA